MLLHAALAGKGGGDDAAGIVIAIAAQVFDHHVGVGKSRFDQRFDFGCWHRHETSPGLVLALPSTALHKVRDGGFRQSVQFSYRYGSLVTELQFTACTGAADGRSRHALRLCRGQQGVCIIRGDDIACLVLALSLIHI